MGRRDVLKRLGVSIGTMLAMTGLLLVLFRDNLRDFSAACRALSLGDVLCLAGLGAVYPVMDGLALHRFIRHIQPDFRRRNGIEVTYLGVFGKVSTLAAGTLPMQSYYLHRCGVQLGRGVGMMTLRYVVHKAAVVLFATAMLLVQGRWLRRALPDIHGYILGGYLVCLAAIAAMVLLCTWQRAHRLAVGLLEKIPDRGKWGERSRRLREQLDSLYRETGATLQDKRVLAGAFFLDLLKLGLFCAIPQVCGRMLGLTGLTPSQTELLTALVLLIAGAIPNIAGVGPTEFAFLLLYGPLLGDGPASALLFLFRLSTYYFPFVISVVFFLTIQLRLMFSGSKKRKEGCAWN